MTNSKNRAELKAELKAKTDKLVSQDKELFSNLSKEEITEKKKERAKGFREENRKLIIACSNPTKNNIESEKLYKEKEKAIMWLAFDILDSEKIEDSMLNKFFNFEENWDKNSDNKTLEVYSLKKIKQEYDALYNKTKDRWVGRGLARQKIIDILFNSKEFNNIFDKYQFIHSYTPDPGPYVSSLGITTYGIQRNKEYANLQTKIEKFNKKYNLQPHKLYIIEKTKENFDFLKDFESFENEINLF